MGYAPDPISGKGKRQTEKPQSFSYERDASKCKSRLLVLTPIAKPMNRFAMCSDPRAERPKDEIIEWFKSAPEGSRHERMLWAARKIAHLTGVTEGRAYQMLLVALIEAERQPPDEYLDVLGLTR